MSFAPIPNEEALHGREQELRRFEQSLRALESSVHAKLSILQSSDVHNLPKQDIEQLLQTTQLHNTALEQKHRPGEPRDEDHSIKLHYPGTALSGLHASTQESLATKYHKVVRQLQEKDELILDLRQELAKQEARAEQLQRLLDLQLQTFGDEIRSPNAHQEICDIPNASDITEKDTEFKRGSYK